MPGKYAFAQRERALSAESPGPQLPALGFGDTPATVMCHPGRRLLCGLAGFFGQYGVDQDRGEHVMLALRDALP